MPLLNPKALGAPQEVLLVSIRKHQQCWLQELRGLQGAKLISLPPPSPWPRQAPAPPRSLPFLSSSVCCASFSGCPGKETELTLLGIIMLEICPWHIFTQEHCSKDPGRACASLKGKEKGRPRARPHVQVRGEPALPPASNDHLLLRISQSSELDN